MSRSAMRQFLSLAALLSATACGPGVRISQNPSASESGVPQYKPTGLICSDTGPARGAPIRFAFVVDNSLSNLGGEYVQKVGEVGSDLYVHTLGTHILEAITLGQSNFGNPGFDISTFLGSPPMTLQQFGETIVVSDKAGVRFDAIKKFIDEPACVSISGSAAYSIHGFADNVQQPIGAGASCESPFVEDATSFKSQVDGVRKYQSLDLSRAKTIAGGPQSVYQMGSTNYRSGLLCASRKIESDAYYSAADAPFYYTIFLSDGLATDKYDPCSQFYRVNVDSRGNEHPYLFRNYDLWQKCIADSNVQDCYTEGARCPNRPFDPRCVEYGSVGIYRNWTCINRVFTPKIVRDLKSELNTVGAGFRLQPVFYWPKDRESLSDFANAQQVLDPMAQEGGTDSVIRLDSGTEILDLAKKICSKIDANLKTNFTISSYMAVNLTARLRNGELTADSDMDGLTDDEEELVATLNPTLARSDGKVLDGLCRDLKGACSSLPTCDPTRFLGLGLNECDQKALQGQTSSAVTAIDSDGDTLLDFVELLKGSRTLRADADELTGTGDNYTKKFVISRGLDLGTNNLKTRPAGSQLMDAQFRFVEPSAACGGNRESLQVTLSNVPLVKARAFEDRRTDALSLRHAADENVIAIIYQVTPIGREDLKVKTYIKLFRISLLHPPSDKIQPSSFIELVESP